MYGLKRGMQFLTRGAPGPLRGDSTGALVTTDGHARFHEAVVNGAVWHAATQAGVTLNAGIGNTPIFCLFNPINSPVYLVVWHVDIVFTGSGAANKFMLTYVPPNVAGVPTGASSVTSANVTNGILSAIQSGSATAVTSQGPWGQAYSACTLSASSLNLAFAFPLGSTGATTIGGMNNRIQCDGNVVIPPGVAMTVQCVAAATLGFAAACWEEVPIG